MRILPRRNSAFRVTSVVYSDDFNRADELLNASSDWTLVSGTNRAEIVSNKCEFQDSSTGSSTYLFEQTLSGDQFVQADYGPLGSSAQTWSIWIMSDGTTDNYYRFYYRKDTNTYNIFKVVSGTETTLDTNTTFGPPTDGDTLRLELVGSTLTGTVEGVTVCTGTASDFSSGKPAFNSYVSNLQGNATYDNFSCGEL